MIDASGRCIAALSVVAPEQRLVKPNRDYLIVSVMNAAEKLSRMILAWNCPQLQMQYQGVDAEIAVKGKVLYRTPKL